jgi:hypothetical protein
LSQGLWLRVESLSSLQWGMKSMFQLPIWSQIAEH